MKKTILFLIPTLGSGGAERVLVNLANFLDKEKFDVTIQTLFDEGINKDDLSHHIRYKTFMKHQFHGNARLIELMPPQFLYKSIVKEHYDIVVSFLEGPTARIISGCTYRDSKIVYWIHTTIMNSTMFKLGFLTVNGARKAYRKSSKIIGVSGDVAKSFQKYLNVDGVNIETFYNVNDSNLIKLKANEPVKIDLPKESLKVCSLGKLQKVKGFERLIHAHKRLIEEGLKHYILIIGEGDQRKELEKLISDNEIEDTFRLIGFCKNPYKYIANCDLYVCSSYREGLSTAVTEALILGTPVVSTRCAGADELLGKNNEFGIVCENTENGIYEGLKQLLTDNELLNHYRQRATERGKRFNTQETTRMIECMFEQL